VAVTVQGPREAAPIMHGNKIRYDGAHDVLYHTTKGISAFAILMQESHGHIDVDQKVTVAYLS